MRVTVDINAKAFANRCEATISKVGRNTRKATIEACKEISEESLRQVPRDTSTLASSQFWDVTGTYKLGWYGTIGYGGNGNPINPKNGHAASDYMVDVHEDLSVYHKVGKAKFLEDPIREYYTEKFPRTVMEYVESALD